MLKSLSLKSQPRIKYALQQPKRQFIIASALTLGSFILGKEARLADAMDAGELHNKNENYELKRHEELEKRIKALQESRPVKPQYEGHVPLYAYEKVLLTMISGIKSYYHPEDGNNIVQLGEATALPMFLENLKNTMLADFTGRKILREKPNITSDTLHMEELGKMGKDTLGYTYYKWLKKEGVSPDTRAPVKYIDDPIHAYVFKRYRQCHDFYHAINDLPIVIEGEIAVKALEASNLGVPMAILGTLLAPLRLKPVQRKRLEEDYLPWAIKTGLSCKPLINVYWEKILNRNINELRSELGIVPPPDLRATRKQRSKMRNELRMKYENFE